jgi:hypothetical protein
MAAYVKTTTFTTVTAGTSQVLSLTNTVGNLLVMTLRTRLTTTSATPAAVTDSAGQTWVRAGASPDATTTQTQRGEIWYIANSASITSVTVTLPSSGASEFDVLEFSGVVATSALDQTGEAHPSSTAISTSTTGSITGTNEVMVALSGGNTQTETVSGVTAGWTANAYHGSNTAAGVLGMFSAYTVTDTPGVQTFAATFGTSTTGRNLIVTFFATATPLAIDASTPTAYGQSASAGGSASTGSFSPPANAFILLVICTAGDQVTGTVTTTSGTALTWTRYSKDVGAAAAQGDLELWYTNTTTAPGAINVTATQVAGTHGGTTGMYISMLPIVFTGAESTPGGATAVQSSVTLYTNTLAITTTRANSYVLGIGFDQNLNTARTIGAAQTMIVDQGDLVGDEVWSQYVTSHASVSGTSKTVNDTSPQMIGAFRAIEIRAPGASTTRPFRPTMSIRNAVSRAANF